MKIRLNDISLNVEVAKTDSQRKLGLMHRKSMLFDYGMLFLFDNNQKHVSFHMKNTFIPLDIIYIDDKLHIVQIDKMDALTGKSSCSMKPKYAIEINQGFCNMNNIKVGDKMSFSKNRLNEAYVDIIDIEVRIRVSLNQQVTFQDILTKIRGLLSVVTVTQVGILHPAPESKKVVNLNVRYEDVGNLDKDEFYSSIKSITGVDMVRIISFNGKKFDELGATHEKAAQSEQQTDAIVKEVFKRIINRK